MYIRFARKCWRWPVHLTIQEAFGLVYWSVGSEKVLDLKDTRPADLNRPVGAALVVINTYSDVQLHVQFWTFDLDLWPITLTYDPSLFMVKVDPHAKNQGSRPNSSGMRARTNTQTNRLIDATKSVIYQVLTQSKADRPYPRNYPHTSTDYRHKNRLLRLVMTLAALCCTRQSRVPTIDCCAPKNLTLTLTHDLDLELWPWPRPLTLTLKQGNSNVKTRFLACDLDLRPWPTIPT